MYSVLPAIVSTIFLGYGFYALSSRGMNRLTGSFFLLCLTTFFWQATWAVLFQTQNAELAGFLVKFGYFFILFLPTSMYYFLTEISGRREERRYVYFSYLFSGILTGFLFFSDLFISGYYQFFWGFYPKAGVLHPIHLLQTSMVAIRSLLISYESQKTALANKRTQLLLCMATLFFFLLSAVDYLCNYGFEFYPPGVLFLAISLIFFTIAIVNYDLFNPLTVAATVAHEMRTPLASIRAQATGLSQYLPTLLEGYKLAIENDLMESRIDRRTLDYISDLSHKIAGEVEKSNTVIDMMLAFSSMERPESIEFGRYSVIECINEAMERFPFDKDIKEKISITAAEDFEFLGSNTLLVFVLFNLLKNSIFALQFARKGEIRIATKKSSGRNYLSFTDTGSGIPENVLPYIFDTFYTTKSNQGGAGIGLSFCKKVLTSFKGSIRCNSVEGEFTTFVLEFPAI